MALVNSGCGTDMALVTIVDDHPGRHGNATLLILKFFSGFQYHLSWYLSGPPFRVGTGSRCGLVLS